VQNIGAESPPSFTATDGYRRTGGQAKQLRAAGAEKVWRETASGAKTDRTQLRRVINLLDAGDVLFGQRLGPRCAASPVTTQRTARLAEDALSYPARTRR
jgi:hypothetical protein